MAINIVLVWVTGREQGLRDAPIWVFTLFGTVFCIFICIVLFLNTVFVVRALLKGDRSCQLSSTSHPLHKPWLKSLSPPAIFSYPNNTPSACRCWRVCSPALRLSAWYVTITLILVIFIVVAVQIISSRKYAWYTPFSLSHHPLSHTHL